MSIFQLLKEVCLQNPDLLNEVQKQRNPTRFEKALLSVSDPRYLINSHERLAIAKKRYQHKLQKCAQRLRQVARVKPANKAQDQWDNEVSVSHIVLEEDDNIEADHNNGFNQDQVSSVSTCLLASYPRVWHQIHYHECPIHTKGCKVFEIELQKAQDAERQFIEGKQESKLSSFEKAQLDVHRRAQRDASQFGTTSAILISLRSVASTFAVWKTT